MTMFFMSRGALYFFLFNRIASTTFQFAVCTLAKSCVEDLLKQQHPQGSDKLLEGQSKTIVLSAEQIGSERQTRQQTKRITKKRETSTQKILQERERVNTYTEKERTQRRGREQKEETKRKIRMSK